MKKLFFMMAFFLAIMLISRQVYSAITPIEQLQSNLTKLETSMNSLRTKLTDLSGDHGLSGLQTKLQKLSTPEITTPSNWTDAHRTLLKKISDSRTLLTNDEEQIEDLLVKITEIQNRAILRNLSIDIINELQKLSNKVSTISLSNNKFPLKTKKDVEAILDAETFWKKTAQPEDLDTERKELLASTLKEYSKAQAFGDSRGRVIANFLDTLQKKLFPATEQIDIINKLVDQSNPKFDLNTYESLNKRLESQTFWEKLISAKNMAVKADDLVKHLECLTEKIPQPTLDKITPPHSRAENIAKITQHYKTKIQPKIEELKKEKDTKLSETITTMIQKEYTYEQRVIEYYQEHVKSLFTNLKNTASGNIATTFMTAFTKDDRSPQEKLQEIFATLETLDHLSSEIEKDISAIASKSEQTITEPQFLTSIKNSNADLRQQYTKEFPKHPSIKGKKKDPIEGQGKDAFAKQKAEMEKLFKPRT